MEAINRQLLIDLLLKMLFNYLMLDWSQTAFVESLNKTVNFPLKNISLWRLLMSDSTCVEGSDKPLSCSLDKAGKTSFALTQHVCVHGNCLPFLARHFADVAKVVVQVSHHFCWHFIIRVFACRILKPKPLTMSVKWGCLLNNCNFFSPPHSYSGRYDKVLCCSCST